MTVDALFLGQNLELHRYYVTDNPYRSPSEVAPPITDIGVRRRPLIITIICLLYFASIVIYLFQFWRNLPTIWYRMGAAFTLYLVAAYVLLFVCFIGFWRMARWAIYLYLALILSGHVATYMMELEFSPVSVVFDGFVLLTGLAYYGRMRWHL